MSSENFKSASGAGEVVRVGGTEVIPVNLRIISATNQDLGRLVKKKSSGWISITG